ncbi:unnamed protein product [Kuraishia capsulata CBS 1993]|uniref:chitinase n=1 Tax=Kuraishia capsulata CBS 1993 TaxID=1382522 RepID=W6MXK3_9ASCO|nr:uncharacterized protein KUCA_T00005026001 [Kuraishia capsulata CBS 1993]CDK29040.1 unnamed protein product [Kuraishia capsulata CBS 1993]
MFSQVTIFALLSFWASAALAYNADSKDNVVLYWGQASAGSQERLSYYCESDAADIIVLSFMTEFSSADTLPVLNFASACSSTFSDGLLDCDEIASDIQTCQDAGKLVLLSLGGASGSYGFASDSDAEGFAGTLWNMFGGGSADERPFGTSVLDGFDFDIENNDSTGYAALAKKLRKYYAEDTSKSYYISAAPQCVYPDASVGDLLENADVDFAFVQFYNNYCNLDESFNWDTWADYAVNTSPNSDIKLFIGLPASSSAAGSGYVDASTVKSTVKDLTSTDNLGGIMLWDASQAFSNTGSDGDNFAVEMKSVLNDVFGSATSSASSAASASSTASSDASSTVSSTASSTETEEVSSTEATSVTSSTEISSAEPSSTEISSSSVSSSESSSSVSSTETSTISSTESSTLVSSTEISASVSSTESSTSVSSTSVPVAAPTTSAASSPTVTEVATTPVDAEVVVSTPASATSIATASPLTTLSTVYISSSSSTTTASTAAATSTGASYTDCSGLSGLAEAKCLNENFDAGLFLGSADSCTTEGDLACTADGNFAICNFGKWVVMGCPVTTSCYAYTQGSEVDIGCNYANQKNSFVKRSSIFDIFKA